ncbi:kinase-like domain-containing protein [Lentinula guzmanii]|uniref:Kinase-like domain-containing protein n=1 Tax=Lentinula guzmanii TaxID=2804957 RepID=A0AA38MY99_9AGAR|nr:kinase-like domain-containing protein [Lentinula guzmanii]
MHSDAFDVIPYEVDISSVSLSYLLHIFLAQDIKGEWKTLGSGSFGKVYKGDNSSSPRSVCSNCHLGIYLGLDVAIKEVLPSTEYDVSKYFEREWRLMKESRHPNIVLFLGLSRAPDPDNRIFIVSEFIDNGNLRYYIHDKNKPFPWRLRLSFATDIARALAYLHARKCIHRDLKGENLLVTANGRLKITDFGFARIAARNEAESKRLTFCGTDSYMSPEILLGEEFDLPTDIFSFGVILCEIAARRLADDHHFKRAAPTFSIDTDEVRRLANPECPPDFISLCIECCSSDPAARPTTRQILERLRIIEAEVLSRPNEGEDVNVGSIKFMTGHKRPAPQPRIPSFGMGVGKEIRASGSITDDSDDDDELMEAVQGLSGVGLNSDWTEMSNGNEPLLQGNGSAISEYSTTVIRAHPNHASNGTQPPSLSSILTIRASPDPNATPNQVLPGSNHSPEASTIMAEHPLNGSDLLGHSSILSIDSLDSYHTAAGSSIISSTMATEGGSTVKSLHGNFAAPLVHRFTILKPGAKPTKKSNSGNSTPSSTAPAAEPLIGWNPFDLFFSSGSLVSKCDICSKRFGPWKPILECDDCGLKAHVKCGDDAPRDCGVRPSHPRVHHQPSNSLGKLKFGKDKTASPPR